MPGRKIFLAIQPLQSVARDTLRNRHWIAGAILLIAAWIIVATALFWWVERAQHYGWFDCLYFTLINLTTVGFGDIVPKTSFGKCLAIVNSLVGLMSFGVLVAIITSALQPSGFTASGAITEPAEPPKSPEPDLSSTQHHVPKSLAGALDFLNALGALLDEHQETRHTHARLILSPAQEGESDIIIDFHIAARRRGGDAEAAMDTNVHNS